MQQTLAKLNTLPEPKWDWSPITDTALRGLSFTSDDAPDLIAIANCKHIPDDPEHEPTDTDWHAATHAYRALAELRDPAHLPVFLDLLNDPDAYDDDFLNEDIITILPLFGDAAVQPCLSAIQDQNTDQLRRLIYVDILEELATSGHGKTAIIQHFSTYLVEKHFTRTLNASIIATLITLDASSEIDAIRVCHQADLTDITMNGDLENVEIDLGIRDSRSSDTHPSWLELEQHSLHRVIKKGLGPRPDDDIELFCYLFDLYRRDCSANGLSGMHATLTGAIIARRLVKPSEIFAFIWDMDQEESPYTPAWENREDAEFFMQFVMAMYNQTIESLDSGTFEPLPDEFADTPDSTTYAMWLLSLNRSIGHWNPVKSLDDLHENYHQIISITSDVIRAESHAMEQGTLPDVTAEITQLRQTLSSIYRNNQSTTMRNPTPGGFYSEQYTRDDPKISRNAPCPCGSGKKYKRCCMN